MKSTPNRREVMGALAASATLQWATPGHAAGPGSTTARVSARRVRPGAVIMLECPGANGFELRLDNGPPKVYPASNGAFRFRAPGVFSRGPWAQIRCTPLAAGGPIGPATTVAVYVAFPGYGA
jgi:hypothetical protein